LRAAHGRPAHARRCPALVLRQAQDEVLRTLAVHVGLMVSLSNHEDVAPGGNFGGD